MLWIDGKGKGIAREEDLAAASTTLVYVGCVLHDWDEAMLQAPFETCIANTSIIFTGGKIFYWEYRVSVLEYQQRSKLCHPKNEWLCDGQKPVFVCATKHERDKTFRAVKRNPSMTIFFTAPQRTLQFSFGKGGGGDQLEQCLRGLSSFCLANTILVAVIFLTSVCHLLFQLFSPKYFRTVAVTFGKRTVNSFCNIPSFSCQFFLRFFDHSNFSLSRNKPAEGKKNRKTGSYIERATHNKVSGLFIGL